ncbi:HNH endonuclease [Candidatus Woesearchaeota archaeon]|nr:HNH endonuclease [Candidatus Woesearchaeota archaeon]
MSRCIICWQEFKKINNRQKYCSKKCYNVKVRRLTNKYILNKKQCELCNKTFIPNKNHPKAKFCSKKCNKKNYYLEHRNLTLKYPHLWDAKKYCKFCNRLIKFNRNNYIVSELARKFCSEKCRRALANIKRRKHILKEKECLYCKGIFKPHYLHPQTRFCSYKCNAAYNYYNKYKSLISKYPKGFETIKHCKKCGKQIIFDKSKPMNTELIRNYCSNKCRSKESHYRFKIKNPEGYKEKIKRRRQSEKGKIAHRFSAKKRKYMLKNIITAYTAKEEMELKSKGICFGYKRKPHFVGKSQLEIDHKCPVSKANKYYIKTGKKKRYTIKNVQPLCRDCNQEKLDKI